MKYVVVSAKLKTFDDYLRFIIIFLQHPGGHDVLLEHAGRDATIAFRGVGHSIAAIKSLDRFQIGELPLNEKIFRTPTGIKLSGVPV